MGLSLNKLLSVVGEIYPINRVVSNVSVELRNRMSTFNHQLIYIKVLFTHVLVNCF